MADWNTEVQDAKQVSAQTGIDYRVILSQLVSEEGWNFLDYSSHNYGNITYYGGQNQTGYFKASNGQKFAIYPSAAAGLQAYANLLNSPTYAAVAQGKTPQAEIAALQASPWDAGHYKQLPGVYNSVVQKTGDTSGQVETTGTPSNSSGTWKPDEKFYSYALLGIAGVFILGALI